MDRMLAPLAKDGPFKHLRKGEGKEEPADAATTARLFFKTVVSKCATHALARL